MRSTTAASLTRGFHQLSRAWYAGHAKPRSEILDEVLIGCYAADGAIASECAFVWKGTGGLVLTAVEGSWLALANFTDLLVELGSIDGQAVSPERFVEILKQLGIEDRTAVVRKS